MKKSILAAVSLLLICGVVYSFISTPSYTFTLTAEEGTADLRDTVSTGEIVQITDGWESYIGKLYTPEDFVAGTVSAPVEWDNKYGEGESVGSHRMTLLLLVGETTSLRFRSIDYATKVYIDGELAGEVGKVGATKETTTPRVGDCYFVVTPKTTETEIILQYANFHHRSGGHPPELTVGAPAGLMRLAQREVFSQVMAAGLLFTAFLYHIAMFFLYGGRRTFLYFSLCALAFSIRALLPFGIILFPDYNWPLMIRFEYIDIFSGAALLMLFFRSLFPELLTKRVLWTVAALLAFYNIIVVFTAPAFFSRLLVFIQPLCVLAIGYIAARIGLGLKTRGAIGFLAFVGIAFFLITAVNDVLYLNKLPNIGANLMPVGIVVFMLAYMMILSMEFSENERRLEAEAGRLEAEARLKEQALAADNTALDRLNRMKSEMIAMVSHETMTPLAVLSGYAELIAMELREKGVDEQTAKDLENIAEETQRISWLIDELQNHTRKQDDRLFKTRLNLLELTLGVMRLYTPILDRRHTSLTYRFTDTLPDVYACASEITQVYFNLLQNARNHTENGVVTITIEPDDDFVAVTVSDTGGGISPELLPRVFERGVSVSDGGGLGLYICKEIINSHNGTIDISSEPGKGTSLRFTLPVWKRGMRGDAGQKDDIIS